ncbi:MAG TPA: hypothetical protein VKD91_02320 [Pyrinomonadaceae bacterium]|nr:hypothetical protein [Pyrinomonadaceae bacterium]
MKSVAGIVLVAIILSGQLAGPIAAGARPQANADSIVGAVIEINTAGKSATIKMDTGQVTIVKVDDRTSCWRIPPGEKNLAHALKIPFADIAPGDRVLGHGAKSADGFYAQRLIVLAKAEVEKKRAHDLEEWRRRGIGGIVREVNAQSGEINLELRSAVPGPMIVSTGKAAFHRYVPGSLRFEDAEASRLADIKVGDQLKALGDRSADNRRFDAEEIVSGAFRTIGVTLLEINPQSHELKAATLDLKKPVVITINQDSVLHRITPPLAAAIAQKAQGAKSSVAPGGGPRPAQPVVDVQQMIDTLPAISFSDLKPGDVLAVTGAVEKDDSRLVAIKLAAGVDLVLKALTPPGKTQTVRLSAGLPAVFDFSVVAVN